MKHVPLNWNNWQFEKFNDVLNIKSILRKHNKPKLSRPVKMFHKGCGFYLALLNLSVD